MAHIIKPTKEIAEASSVSGFLEALTNWRTAQKVSSRRYHSNIWYRGHSRRVFNLEPGVYRTAFTNAAKACYGRSDEEKRLNLEREMLTEFRTAGATFSDPDNVVSFYFIAQHYGMPTRLLDWTANPLAALFFAVTEHETEDGDAFVMDAPQLVPKSAEPDLYKFVLTMRHPYATDAIGVSFWHPDRNKRKPLILPIRPDNQLGRISQQSSCFTLHMHQCPPTRNGSLACIKIPAGKKVSLRQELHRLNVNQFTIYNDLDHLSKEIKQSWGV